MGDESGERGLKAVLAASRATMLWPDGSLRQPVNSKCLMNPSPTVPKVKYTGPDVHAETIAVAIAESTGSIRAYGIIPAHTHAVDKLDKKLADDGSEVRYCYEAGPTGFWLCRHLRQKGVSCEVIAPSLIPQEASDRVKTDRRDALNLARLFRAGELTPVTVPDETDEALRDLVRTRLAAVERRCSVARR